MAGCRVANRLCRMADYTHTKIHPAYYNRPFDLTKASKS